jgi:hypothetical protein
MNEKQIHILGLDFGAGAIKFAGDAGEGELIAQVSSARKNQKRALNLDPTGMLGKARAPDYLQADFGAFYVGAGAHDYGRAVEGLEANRFGKATIETRALYYSALAHYLDGHPPAPLRIVVGLPLEPMLGDDAELNKAAVAGWMRGQHRFTFAPQNGREREVAAEVDSVIVTSQAVAAFFYAALDDEGGVADAELLKSEVGVISIGFSTMELFAVAQRAPIRNLCASSPVGVQRLLSLADPDRRWTLGELDARLRARALDIAHVLPVWAREVEAEIARCWGRAAKRFSRVIAVGGGALLLRDALSAIFAPYLAFPDDPIMAVARGLRKIARKKHGKT